ncbi:hypothetical protein F5Y16DRAFT_356201 [Xylariaceae sp. FL0255]|nr:hypothetical protein F5Y16DRAFT_356201 [Xylariaceae sp. FL0255]
MKYSGLVSLLAVAASATKCTAKHTPTTKIAGVEVIYTELVQQALAQIEVFKPLQPYLYNHLMRSWLYGAAALNNNATLKAEIDLEVHAVGTLLHDLGWDMRNDTPWHSLTRPFEVDSGLGAMAWVQERTNDWTAVQLEQMYDGITLQGAAAYLPGKNINTKWIVQSVEFEFPGPRSPLIPNQYYDSIQAAYTNDTVFRGTNETFTWLALTKPAGTHGSFIDQFGVAYVSGYGPLTAGTIAFDLITEGVANEIANNPNVTFHSNL